MYYRFKNGIFIKAETFGRAKDKLIALITAEVEDPNQWHECTCTGFQHRHDCPVGMKGEVSF